MSELIRVTVKGTVQFYTEEIEPKSPRAKKSFLTRHLNIAQKELDYIKAHQSKDRTLYLGDPIELQIRNLENEIIGIKKVQTELLSS